MGRGDLSPKECLSYFIPVNQIIRADAREDLGTRAPLGCEFSCFGVSSCCQSVMYVLHRFVRTRNPSIY